MGERYPALSAELANQLRDVPLTGCLYRPCQITLDDETVRDRVYVVDARPWFKWWGVWPEDDEGKSSLPLQRVSLIVDSPSRLPPRYAEKLYAAGESGMGYTIFTVNFNDGSDLALQTGNAIDFIEYPSGQSGETVVDVLPHVGRYVPGLTKGPDYTWCLYDGYDTISVGS